MRRYWMLAVAAVAFTAGLAAQGPLRPLGQVNVRADTNGALSVTSIGACDTLGPLATGSSVLVRSDSNGALQVCGDIGGGSGDLSETDIDASAELAAIMDDESGTGLLVFNDTPTLVTPTIANFTNAVHDHLDADDGGTLNGSVLTSGTVDPARLGSGASITTKFLRGDSTWQTVGGGGDALVANSLAQFAATTSAEMITLLTNETGTGVAVFGTGPTLGLPILSGMRPSNTAVKTADYTVSANDVIVPTNAAGTSVTIVLTLPTAASVGGSLKCFPRLDTDADGTVTLDGNGAETIAGAATYGIGLNSALCIYSDATNWQIFSDASAGLADPGANSFLYFDNTTKLNAYGATSTILAGILTDELGTGKVIFSAGTLAISSGKTATIQNTLTFSGTDASSVAFGTGGTVAYTTGTTFTGGTIPLAHTLQFATAVCQNVTASAAGSAPTTLGAQPGCHDTTAASGDPAYGYVVFPSGGADTEWHERFELPADWTGAVDVTLIWNSSNATTNDVVWEIAIGCVAAGEAATAISFNDQAFTADTNNGTTLQLNSVSKTGLTMTGCAAGETAFFFIHRDTDTAGDTLDQNVNLISVVFTIRRAVTIGG